MQNLQNLFIYFIEKGYLQIPSEFLEEKIKELAYTRREWLIELFQLFIDILFENLEGKSSDNIKVDSCN